MVENSLLKLFQSFVYSIVDLHFVFQDKKLIIFASPSSSDRYYRTMIKHINNVPWGKIVFCTYSRVYLFASTLIGSNLDWHALLKNIDHNLLICTVLKEGKTYKQGRYQELQAL